MWKGTRCEYVYEKLQLGLQRSDVAAGLGLTADELEGFIQAGCVQGCDDDLRLLAKAAIDGETACKEDLLTAIKAGKNWMGAAWLLEHRFKGSWGKESKPAPEGVPSNSIDWDSELALLLDDEHSPLVQYLYSRGFGKLPETTSETTSLPTLTHQPP